MGDVQEILRPPGLSLHVNEVVDRGHKECPAIDRDRDRALAECVEPVAFANQEIHLGTAVRRPEIERQHSFFILPTPNLFDIADSLQRFRNTRTYPERPQEIDSSRPRIGRQTRNNVEIECNARTAVESRGDSADNRSYGPPIMPPVPAPFRALLPTSVCGFSL